MTTKAEHTFHPDGDVSIRSPAIAAVGDVVATPTDPILTPPHGSAPADQGGEVVYNGTLAALQTGSRCITVIHGTAWLTPVEAARLGSQLIDMAKVAADERTLRGYDE